MPRIRPLAVDDLVQCKWDWSDNAYLIVKVNHVYRERGSFSGVIVKAVNDEMTKKQLRRMAGGRFIDYLPGKSSKLFKIIG